MLFCSSHKPLSTNLPHLCFCLSSRFSLSSPRAVNSSAICPHLAQLLFRSPNPFTLSPFQVINKWLYFPSSSHRCSLHFFKNTWHRCFNTTSAPADASSELRTPTPFQGGKGISLTSSLKGHTLLKMPPPQSCARIESPKFESIRALNIEARSPQKSQGQPEGHF